MRRLSVLALLLAACGDEPPRDETPFDAEAALENPSLATLTAPDTFTVRFETTEGPFVVEVFRSWAPRGADRFYNLVRMEFFDGAKFFRVERGFVVQFGLHADGAVNRVWFNANIRDEPRVTSNTRGTICFAKTGAPHSRATQLFINTGNNARSLDPQGFAPFGRVLEGMDVVDKLYAGYAGRPNQSQIVASGNAYLERTFPKLDAIESARIVD